MTTMELVLCSLGEVTATVYHRNRDSQGFDALKKDARDAGVTAGKARRVIEEDIGESVVSPKNYLKLPASPGEAKPTKPKQLKAESQLSMFDDSDKE